MLALCKLPDLSVFGAQLLVPPPVDEDGTSSVEASGPSTGGLLTTFTTRSFLAEGSVFAAAAVAAIAAETAARAAFLAKGSVFAAGGCANVLLSNDDELFSAGAAVEGDTSEDWSCFRFLDFACSEEAAGAASCDE